MSYDGNYLLVRLLLPVILGWFLVGLVLFGAGFWLGWAAS